MFITLKDKELMKNPEVADFLSKVDKIMQERMAPVLESDLYKEGLTELATIGTTYKLHEAFKEIEKRII